MHESNMAMEEKNKIKFRKVIWDVGEQLWEVIIILQKQKQSDEWDADEHGEGDFEIKGNHGDGFDEGK